MARAAAAPAPVLVSMIGAWLTTVSVTIDST
jgi:hypothetical protein